VKRRGKSPPGFRVSEIVRQTPCGARQSRGKGCLSALSIQRKLNGRVTSGNSRISVATVYRSAQRKLGEINDRQPAQAGHRIRLTPQKGRSAREGGPRPFWGSILEDQHLAVYREISQHSLVLESVEFFQKLSSPTQSCKYLQSN